MLLELRARLERRLLHSIRQPSDAQANEISDAKPCPDGPLLGAVIAVGCAYLLRGPGGAKSVQEVAQGKPEKVV